MDHLFRLPPADFATPAPTSSYFRCDAPRSDVRQQVAVAADRMRHRVNALAERFEPFVGFSGPLPADGHAVLFHWLIHHRLCRWIPIPNTQG